MMKSLIVQLDDPTHRALTRIAQVSKRQRAEFVRSAIRKAMRETEEERTRRAYAEQPDSEKGGRRLDLRREMDREVA